MKALYAAADRSQFERSKTQPVQLNLQIFAEFFSFSFTDMRSGERFVKDFLLTQNKNASQDGAWILPCLVGLTVQNLGKYGVSLCSVVCSLMLILP